MVTDIPERIKKFNAGRENISLQLKYKAMAESPFRFFRGSCGLFYEELVKQYLTQTVSTTLTGNTMDTVDSTISASAVGDDTAVPLVIIDGRRSRDGISPLDAADDARFSRLDE